MLMNICLLDQTVATLVAGWGWRAAVLRYSKPTVLAALCAGGRVGRFFRATVMC